MDAGDRLEAQMQLDTTSDNLEDHTLDTLDTVAALIEIRLDGEKQDEATHLLDFLRELLA